MVSIRRAKQGFQVRNRHGKKLDPETLGLIALGVGIGMFLVVYGRGGSGEDSNVSNRNPLFRRKPHPQLYQDVVVPDTPGDTAKTHHVLKRMGDNFDAMAMDIMETLDCATLFNQTILQLKGSDSTGAMDDEPQRRLMDSNPQHGDDGGFENFGGAAAAEGGGDDTPPDEDEEEEKWGREAMGGLDGGGGDFGAGMGDDIPPGWLEGNNDMGFAGFATITAKHLFCLAATPNPPKEIVDEISCQASESKRAALLNLWSSARVHIPDNNLLLKVLGLARENKYETLLDKGNYNLWAPVDDEGYTYSKNTISNELSEILTSMDESLGPGKVFVDVGSCLGLTTIAVSQRYPGTKVVSIEPASPNWLLQQMNLRCNLEKPELSKIKSILAGVGPNREDEDDMLAKLMWRPSATTATRSWTPAEEQKGDDVELLVDFRKLESILAEAEVYLSSDGRHAIDVLNLDCQGCEYNLIPALTEPEFDSIPNIMGSVHWGHIPLSKLPSSVRGRETHERICQHENIAKNTKECCSALNVPVKSRIPGEVLYKDSGHNAGHQHPQASTVADIINEGLCADFEIWASEHSLYSVQDDWGWFELSSQA